MTITTEEAERLAERVEDEGGLSITATALRSLAAERDALKADLKAQFERAELTDVLHKQHVTKLEAENARLREALILTRIAVSHACDLSDRILYTQDLRRIDAALGEKDNAKA
jgi:hypothetical protein